MKLFFTLVHEVPDQVRDDGEELILRQAQDDIWKIEYRLLDCGFRIFVFESFWVVLLKLLCTLIHEIPDQVRNCVFLLHCPKVSIPLPCGRRMQTLLARLKLLLGFLCS